MPGVRVERFADQPLRDRPHLAVLFQDKLGGFVVATPLLRGLKEKYQGATLDYFGGALTAELEESSPFVDARYSLFGNPTALRDFAGFVQQREQQSGPYDLAINLDFHPLNALVMPSLNPRYVVGRCFDQQFRSELPIGPSLIDQLQTATWTGESFLADFDGVVQSNFIGEIFCRMAYVTTDFHRVEVPTRDPGIPVPDVLVATGATRSAKQWPIAYWKQLVDLCASEGLSVGLLGAPPARQRERYSTGASEEWLLRETALVDLRGRLTLPCVAGALARARACVSIDNGIMHLAYAVGTPTIALFGASPWQLWAPSLPTLHLAATRVACDLCEKNRFRNADCLRERHACMESITPEDVFAQLTRFIQPQSIMHVRTT